MKQQLRERKGRIRVQVEISAEQAMMRLRAGKSHRKCISPESPEDFWDFLPNELPVVYCMSFAQADELDSLFAEAAALSR